MTKTADVTGARIVLANREGCSVNGNPRFSLAVRVGDTDDDLRTFRTQSDAACSYEVTNFVNSKELVDLWLTRSGRVSVIRRSAIQSTQAKQEGNQ